MATRKRIGLVPFQTSGKAHIYWFTFKQLKQARRAGPRRRAARATTRSAQWRAPGCRRYVQGATLDPAGGLYLARSTLACGELVTPGGRRLGFVPGAEGIQFGPRLNRLYAVSESGARPYVRSRKPLTAGVSRFEWPGLGHGRRADCGFPRY